MPIENEKKFVLRPKTSEDIFLNKATQTEHIEQIYLMIGKDQSVRIRRSLIFYPDKYITEWKYRFTFKQDIGKKTVEVETDLSLEDFNLLKKKAVSKFKKVRYKLDGWEIDFFKSGEKTYFIQAEIELPENQNKPEQIHPLIREHLLYEVKRGDGRFSSKKLGNSKYARRLLQKLLLETKV